MRKTATALIIALATPSAWANNAPAPKLLAQGLETLVVSATRLERHLSDAPVRTEVISSHEIETTHARSLKEALENLPGLQLREVHGKSGYEASLQGMSSNQLLILVDSMPLAASTGSSVDLSQYAALDIQHIEVIKGAASAQYGSSAMGGVINIITRPASTGLKGSFLYDAGSYGKQNINQKTAQIAQHHANAVLEGGAKQLTAKFSADMRNTEGFSATPEDWARQGDKSQRNQYTLQLNYQPQTGSYISLQTQVFNEEDKQWLPEEHQLLPNKEEDIKRTRFNLNAGHLFTNSSGLSFKGLTETYTSDSFKQNLGFVPYDQRKMRLETHLAGVQLDLPPNFLGLTNHQLMLGADFRKEELSQTKDGAAEIGTAGKADRTNYEVFFQDDYFFSAKGELLLGVRVQDDSDFGRHISPKLAVKYRLYEANNQQVLLRSSLGTGYRVPNLKERYYTFDHSSIGYQVMGSPNLKPETSISYQAGLLFEFSRTNYLDFNAFYNAIDDLIQIDQTRSRVENGLAIYGYENIESAETYGLESVLHSQLTPSLKLNLAHTYTKATNKTTSKPLTNKPKHLVRLGLDWQATAKWDFALRARYQSKELASSAQSFGGLSLQNASLAWSPAWATLDVKTNYQLLPNLRAFAGVDNLTNKQRDFSSGTDFGPLTGRFIYLGFEAKANFL